tara:strand:- start:10733 stop:11161 length:429 start_codon:yes stop_codon:yes gene_type:complete
MLDVNDRISIPLRELEFEFSRSGGPGGQNVNKTNTRASLRWNVTATHSLPHSVKERFRKKYNRRISQKGDFVLHSQRFRDQGKNVADCLSRLREMILSVSVSPKKRVPTRPTRASKERRLGTKKRKADQKRLRRSPEKDEFS